MNENSKDALQKQAFQVVKRLFSEDRYFVERFTRFIQKKYTNPHTLSPEEFDTHFKIAFQNVLEIVSHKESLYPALLQLAHADYKDKASAAVELIRSAKIPMVVVNTNDHAFINNGLGLTNYDGDTPGHHNNGTVVPWINATPYAEVSLQQYHNQAQSLQESQQSDLNWVLLTTRRGTHDLSELAHEAMAWYLINKLTPSTSKGDRTSMLRAKREEAGYQLGSTQVLFDFLVSNKQAYNALSQMML